MKPEHLLMLAKSMQEISDIRDQYLNYFSMNPSLFRMIRDSRRRVRNLQRQKFLNTEIIYLN